MLCLQPPGRLVRPHAAWARLAQLPSLFGRMEQGGLEGGLISVPFQHAHRAAALCTVIL
jgi:hypothetical protein